MSKHANKAVIIAFIMVVTIISTGCSTVKARETNGIGHAFVATERSASHFVGWNHDALYVPLGILFTLPPTTIDLVFSVVTDVLLFPFDLVITPNNERRRVFGYRYGH